MRLHPWLFAVVIAVAAPAFGQRIEKGSRDDLVNVGVVYVDAPRDSEIRAKLLAALAKELPSIRVVEREEEAQLVLKVTITSTQSGARSEPISEAVPGSRTQSSGVPRPMGRRPVHSFPQPERPGHVSIRDPVRNPFEDQADEHRESESRVRTFVTGEALRPIGNDAYRKAHEFVRRVDGRTRLLAVDDFVRSFAKQYRKANPAQKPQQ